MGFKGNREGAGGKQPPQRNIRREESYDKKDRPGDKKGGRLRDGEQSLQRLVDGEGGDGKERHG